MKLSLVIPTYTLNKELEEMTLACIESYRSQVDEVVISEDGGNFSRALLDMADVYVYWRENAGFTKNLNRGWKLAGGEYALIVNSDTRLVDGDLWELCIPGSVTSPEVVNQQDIVRLTGSCFCVPRSIAKKYGYLNEAMKTYYSDEEYVQRVDSCFTKVSSVKIHHDQAKTVKAAGIEGDTTRDSAVYMRISKK